jgi:hypothetical protein
VSSLSGVGKDAGGTHDGYVQLACAQRPVVRVAGVREELLLEGEETGRTLVLEEVDGARSHVDVRLKARRGVHERRVAHRLEHAVPVRESAADMNNREEGVRGKVEDAPGILLRAQEEVGLVVRVDEVQAGRIHGGSGLDRRREEHKILQRVQVRYGSGESRRKKSEWGEDEREHREVVRECVADGYEMWGLVDRMRCDPTENPRFEPRFKCSGGPSLAWVDGCGWWLPPMTAMASGETDAVLGPYCGPCSAVLRLCSRQEQRRSGVGLIHVHNTYSVGVQGPWIIIVFVCV